MADLAAVRADLEAEQRSLDEVVAALDADQWQLATPSPGWTIADQIGHLTYFDRTAALAITDADAFTAGVAALLGADDVDALTLGDFRALDAPAQLAAWRANRAHLAEVAATLEESDRVVWYGPSMGAKSFLTARMMECWAHGTDVCDTLGIEREPTDRLSHIARLGFNTRGWSYANRGEEVPDSPILVTLTAPSGAVWTFGEESADEYVRGSALDFCLATSQRRNVADTSLELSPAGRHWLERAQLFAGPPTEGPAPRNG